MRHSCVAVRIWLLACHEVSTKVAGGSLSNSLLVRMDPPATEAVSKPKKERRFTGKEGWFTQQVDQKKAQAYMKTSPVLACPETAGE